MQHLLTAIILLPAVGGLAIVAYSLVPGRRESNYKWIALAFSVADFVLVRPLPFAAPSRLAKLWQK